MLTSLKSQMEEIVIDDPDIEVEEGSLNDPAVNLWSLTTSNTFNQEP